jgi:HTH-type transcriptional regulator, sugar sensing transcriptional regulator
MSHNKLTQTLNTLGLNEKEARVYLSAITLGPTTILNIAKNSGLIRSTVYSVIETLKEKGLINIEINGWKKLFVAESPEKLEQLLELRRQEFKKHLPEFMSLYTLEQNESYIRYFEGKQAVRSVWDFILKKLQPGEDYMVIDENDRWLSIDEEYYLNYIKQKAKLNLNCRLLLKDSPNTRKYKNQAVNYNEKIKFLPSSVTFNSDIIITSQKTIIQQLQIPTSAMVIENKSIAQMHKEIFDLLWNMIP